MRTILPLVIVMSALGGVGCDPERLDAVGLFTVVGSMEERPFVVPDRITVGADPILLRTTASDVAAVRYRLGQERRAFLFTGDLRSGITAGDYLLLPQLDIGELERTVDISPFDSTQWRSARVYDSGLCSLQLAWQAGGEGLGELVGIPPLADLLVGAIDSAFTTSGGVQGGRRTTEGRVTPVLRAATGSGSLSRSTDAVRIAATYFATRIEQASGASLGCNDVTVSLAVEVGFERTNGLISNAPGCQQPGDPGGFLQTTTSSRSIIAASCTTSACRSRPTSVAFPSSRT